MPINNFPDKVPDEEMGDVTQGRYRYQAAYAAHVSLGLMQESSHLEKLYCEFHDDILLKTKDGKFTAIQVKTRQRSEGGFKSTDKQILSSIRKFVSLSAQFNGNISKYILASSCGFWTKKKDSFNLPYLVDKAKNGYVSNGDADLTKFIKTLCEGTSYDYAQVIGTLRRVELDHTAPNIPDMEPRLIYEIGKIPEFNGRTTTEVELAAKDLIGHMLDAGSEAFDPAKTIYLIIEKDSKSAELEVELEKKATTKSHILEIFNKALDKFYYLDTGTELDLLKLSKETKRLSLKMQKGSISEHSITSLIERKALAETLFAEWVYRKGGPQTNKDIDHLSTIVKTECDDALSEVEHQFEPYGQEMLNRAKNKINERISRKPELFLGCEYEHILGLVGMLTEKCSVWWSPKFNIPEELLE